MHIALIQKELVRNMETDNLNYLSKLYSINYFKLANFCPNTLQINKYHPLAYKNFIVFEDNAEFYKSSYHTYAAFLLTKIFKNAYDTKMSILTYESYFYKSMLGFMSKEFPELSFDSTLTAKYWMLILEIQLKLDIIVYDKDVVNVIFNHKAYQPFKHINSNIKPFSYYLENFIVVLLKDGTLKIVNFLPLISDINVVNFYTLSTINYYPNINQIVSIYIDLESPKYLIKYLSINEYKATSAKKIYNSYSIDFNSPNLSNCTNCFLQKDCSASIRLAGIAPPIYSKKTNKIKLLNIKEENK